MELSIELIERMAAIGTKSGFFGVKTPEQAAALMLIAQAEGISPALALRDYHVIQGRPTLKSDAMLARFQAAGGKVCWKNLTNEQVTGIFSHSAGGDVEITWTLAMAKSAGLANKDIWKQYPRQMLRSRCISEGVRTVYPAVVCGVYTPEEVESLSGSVAISVEPEPIKESQPIAIEAEVVEVKSPLDAVLNAENLADLRTAFTAAYKAASTEDERARAVAAKDKRKAELE